MGNSAPAASFGGASRVTAQVAELSALGGAGRVLDRSMVLMTGALLLAADVVSFLLSVCMAALVASGLHALFGSAEAGGQIALLDVLIGALPIFLCVAIYCVFVGAYRDRPPFWSEFGRLVAISFYALLAAGFCAFAFRIDGVRAALLVPWVSFPFMAQALRQACRMALDRIGLWRIPAVVIGRPEDAADVEAILSSERLPGYRVVGQMPAAEAVHALSTPDGLGAYERCQIMLHLEPGRPEGQALVELLTRRRVPFSLVPQMADLPIHSCRHASYFSHDAIVLSYRSNLDEPVLRAIKFAFDVLVAGMLLLLSLPVFLTLYIFIAIEGGAPIYGHKRIGHGGREFKCLKFRSMARDGDQILARVIASDPVAAEEWRQTQKLRNDPRITKIGRFVRKTSLDEIPQLLNVLRGEMSLVGPRPIVQAEVHHYGDDIVHYQSTRPGITGLWQVSGRSDTSYPRRVQLDRWYVRNWTLWHDIAILAKTIPAVLGQSGAR